METANVLLAIGGDKRNSVPKYLVTAAEVAVMREIHGHDAVYDIEIVGTINRTHRQEIGRLSEMYGRQDGERRVSPAVNSLYPGAAARVHETFAELELPDEFFIATGRKTAGRPASKPAADPADASDTLAVLSAMTVKDLQAMADKRGVDLTGVTRKADIVEAIMVHETAAAAESDEDADPDDNTGSMDDDIGRNGGAMFS